MRKFVTSDEVGCIPYAKKVLVVAAFVVLVVVLLTVLEK